MTRAEARADHFYHLPLIPLLIALIAGIAAGRMIPFFPIFYAGAWLFGALSALQVVRRLISRKPACLSPLLLFGALGFLSVSPWQSPFFPPAGTETLFNAGYLEIAGTVAGPARIESFRSRCVLDHLEITCKNGMLQHPAGSIQAAFYGSGPDLLPGDRLRFRAVLRPLQNFNNPGGFDYRQFMADRNIWAAVYASGKSVKQDPATGHGTGPGNRIHRLRNSLDAAIAGKDGDDAGAVLSALVVGKRDRIARKTREAFNRAGVSHLLAISGLHVGIVAACAFLAFKWLFCRFQALLYAGRADKTAAVLTLFPVLAYGLISGMSPSTQRALVMAAVFLLAIAQARPYHRINTLVVAALIICVIHPPSLFSVSFQLSFAAVTAIFFGLYIFAKTDSSAKKPAVRLLDRAKGFMLISIFAIAGTMPLVMHHFHQASVMGVVTNLVMVPWIGLGVVPVGLASALIFPFSQTIAGWGLTLAHEILSPAVCLVEAVSKSPVGAFDTFSPTAVEVICAYAIIAGFGMVISGKPKHMQKPAAAGLVLIFLAVGADTGYWLHRRFYHTDLRITVLDVGQGHASLLEFPKGHTMLIDGGGFADNSAFDVGARVIAPFLRRSKIGTIDTVVLSHSDADHLNGLLHILEHFRIGEVISAHRAADTRGYRRFLQILKEKAIHHPPFGRIKARREINGAFVEILFPWPDPDTVCAPCSGANNCSIVVRVMYQGKAVLFPGDIEACAEARLIRQAGGKTDSDVLIAPHHGSNSSSSPEFLRAVDPETVIIPVRQGRYEMPSKSVLDRYQEKKCGILRTDQNGAVHIRIHENKMQIRPEIKTPARETEF